jgi:hypothetical protein
MTEAPGMIRRTRAVLDALWKSTRREQQSLLKLPGNNLYYVAIAFYFMLDPAVLLSVAAVVGVVVFFPMSSDPLHRIPESRFRLWPMEREERWVLRALSPWLNPLTWMVLAFAIWRATSWGLATLVAGLFLVTFAADWRPRGSGRAIAWLPRLPAPLGELIRKNLRQLLRTLDFYCALIVGGAAVIYRAAGLLPSDAHLPGTLLVALAISTCAQTIFGLDGRAGMTRYHLLPIRGWQILLAKDVAFMAVSVLLTAALDPLAGLAASMAGLAAARIPAVRETRWQIRWRLQAGAGFGPAFAQILALIAAATTTHLVSPLFAAAPAVVWAYSLWWGGREFERPVS